MAPVPFPSKGVYHNYYGALAAAPTVPIPQAGDMYYNSVGNIMYYYDASVPGWVAFAASGSDKRQSKVIVGNSLAGGGGFSDTLSNCDFLGDLTGVPAGPGNPALYGIQRAIQSVSGNTKGALIYIREGTYAMSIVGVAPAGWDAPFHLSQMITAPTGPIIIEGSGMYAVNIINNLAAPIVGPTMILDHPGAGGPGATTTPVTIKNFNIRGNGTAGRLAALQGVATLEIGCSGKGRTPVAAAIASNVTVQSVMVDGKNPTGPVYDFIACYLVNTAVAFPVNFNATDSIFKNGNDAAPIPLPSPVGVFQDGNNVNPASQFSTYKNCEFTGGIGAESGFAAATASSFSITNCRSHDNIDCGFRIRTSVNVTISATNSNTNACISVAAGNAGGFSVFNSSYVRMVNCYADMNKTGAGLGWNFVFYNCNNVSVTACHAVGAGSAATMDMLGFLADLGTHIDFINCIANNHGNNTGAANAMGYGFRIGATGATMYVQVNDCSAMGNDNWGLAFNGVAPANADHCQIVGGSFNTNGVVGKVKVPAANARQWTASGTAGQANVLIDSTTNLPTDSVNTTEAVHFVYNFP